MWNHPEAWDIKEGVLHVQVYDKPELAHFSTRKWFEPVGFRPPTGSFLVAGREGVLPLRFFH